MKKSILSLLLLVSFISQAQKETTTPRVFSIQVSLLPAFSSFDYSALNNTLKNNNLPQAKDGLQFTPAIEIISKPFSNTKTFTSVTIGMNTSKNNTNNYVLEQRAIYSELGIGRFIVQKNRKDVFVSLAWGNVWQSVDIHSYAAAPTFNDALLEVGNSMKLTAKTNQYLAINTGFDWAIDKDEDVLIGLRLGYRVGLGKNDWEINSRSYSDSPSYSASGFTIGASLSIR